MARSVRECEGERGGVGSGGNVSLPRTAGWPTHPVGSAPIEFPHHQECWELETSQGPRRRTPH